jgi:hypothetical protein
MLSGIACPISIIGNTSYCFTLGWLIISNFIKLPTIVCIVFLLEFCVLSVLVSVLLSVFVSVCVCVIVAVGTFVCTVTGADWIVGAGVLMD